MSSKLKKKTAKIKKPTVLPLYLCDPEKNIDCKGRYKKGHCGDMCFCTTHPELSIDGKRLSQKDYNNHLKKSLGIKSPSETYGGKLDDDSIMKYPQVPGITPTVINQENNYDDSGSE